MTNKFVASLAGSCLSLAAFFSALSGTACAQGRPLNVEGLFGAILNNALAQQDHQLWANRPIAEYNCLESHNTSADILTNSGIGPNDPRVQRMFAQCAAQNASQPGAAGTQMLRARAGTYNSNFAVDGVSVGDELNPDSAGYKAFKCRASTDYPGFEWCGLRRPMKGPSGPYDTYMTIFHSDANVAVLILQDVIPAYFAPGDSEREIQRLSKLFGQTPHVLNGEPNSDAPHSVIAYWGDVTLTPLAQDLVDAVRRGDAVHAGLVIDYLGDSKKSAIDGMPIFHLGGGAGYVWSAKYDDAGKGRLRLTAVNPSLLPGAVGEQDASRDNPAHTQGTAMDPNPASAPTIDTAKSDADRAARLERATAAAKAQLDDAQAFIQQHAQSPQLLEYVDRMGALAAAVKTTDVDAIELRSTDLSTALSHDKDYQTHLTELAEAQKRNAAKFLGDALLHGEQQRAFLINYISKHPLADETLNFVALVKQLVPTLQKGELRPLQSLIDKIDLAIREARLQDDFVAAQKGGERVAQNAPESPSTPPPVLAMESQRPISPAAAETLPVTDKNKFLIQGDLDDLVIAYNASSTAPHIAQNLRGEYVFSGNDAKICLFGDTPEGFALNVKQAVSAAIAPRTIDVSIASHCETKNLLSYDIVALQRGAFLRAPRVDALALIKAAEGDDYRKFGIVDAAEIRKVAAAEKVEIDRIRTNVADGAPNGFGIAIVRKGSPSLCIAVGDKMASHRQLLLSNDDKISLDLQADVVLKSMSAEDAFVGVQKRQCDAVYASAADLKSLTIALERNGFSYSFSSFWLLPVAIELEDAAIAQKNEALAQEETERAQRNADQNRLNSARAADLNATQAAQQASLRAKYGDAGKAASANLSSEIIEWTKSRNGTMGTSYPAFEAWLNDKLSDHWEVTTTDSDLFDFGTSSFKGRSIDTVFSKITVHLKNRILGEYGEQCFVFGRVNDAEFAMSREFSFARCDDQAAIAAWQVGQQFASEWIVAN